MKFQSLVILSAALASQMSFASQFEKVDSPTRASLVKVYNQIDLASPEYTGVYAITKKTNKAGRTSDEAHEAAIKEAMHKYMCRFFDDGINIVKMKNSSGGAADAIKALDIGYNGGGDEKIEKAVAKIQPLLAKAMASDDVEVYGGDAGGNNTSGNVMGIYDNKNDEVIFFGFTNCGSDG